MENESVIESGSSKQATTEKLVSPLLAHVVGVSAVAVVIVLNWLFVWDIKGQSSLWISAGLIYAQLYREAYKEKFDR